MKIVCLLYNFRMCCVSILAKNFKTNCQKSHRRGCGVVEVRMQQELAVILSWGQPAAPHREAWKADVERLICIFSHFQYVLRSEVIGLSTVNNFLLRDNTNKIATFMPSGVETEPLASYLQMHLYNDNDNVDIFNLMLYYMCVDASPQIKFFVSGYKRLIL